MNNVLSLNFQDFKKNCRSLISVEKTRSTPKYEVRINGSLIFDNENSQNEIVEKLFDKKLGIKKKFLEFLG